MPTYICNNTESDLTRGALFSKEMSASTGPTGSINISIPNSTTDNGIFSLVHGKPSSDSWEGGGNVTFELNVTATNGGGAGTWRARCRVQMRSSDGTVLENGALTAFQDITSTGIKTFTIVVPVWSAQQSCANRLSISVQVNNISGSTRTATFGVGTTDSEVVSPITEDTATCRRIFNS